MDLETKHKVCGLTEAARKTLVATMWSLLPLKIFSGNTLSVSRFKQVQPRYTVTLQQSHQEAFTNSSSSMKELQWILNYIVLL